MIARLKCLIFGHGQDVLHEDGKGAAWTTCPHCGKVTAAHSWVGSRPWDNR